MKAQPVRKKAASSKAASKASNRSLSDDKLKEAVSAYKPGSLLARSGGMVPTVELSKRASKNIS